MAHEVVYAERPRPREAFRLLGDGRENGVIFRLGGKWGSMPHELFVWAEASDWAGESADRYVSKKDARELAAFLTAYADGRL